MLAQRYPKKMLKCNKNNYKSIIIIKSTDISLDRQAILASVIWFEKLSRDHQLSWRKLLKIIILNFILYIIQVYMYTNLESGSFRPDYLFAPGRFALGRFAPESESIPPYLIAIIL